MDVTNRSARLDGEGCEEGAGEKEKRKQKLLEKGGKKAAKGLRRSV
jgi:hypothetical protein